MQNSELRALISLEVMTHWEWHFTHFKERCKPSKKLLSEIGSVIRLGFLRSIPNFLRSITVRPSSDPSRLCYSEARPRSKFLVTLSLIFLGDHDLTFGVKKGILIMSLPRNSSIVCQSFQQRKFKCANYVSACQDFLLEHICTSDVHTEILLNQSALSLWSQVSNFRVAWLIIDNLSLKLVLICVLGSLNVLYHNEDYNNTIHVGLIPSDQVCAPRYFSSNALNRRLNTHSFLLRNVLFFYRISGMPSMYAVCKQRCKMVIQLRVSDWRHLLRNQCCFEGEMDEEEEKISPKSPLLSRRSKPVTPSEYQREFINLASEDGDQISGTEILPSLHSMRSSEAKYHGTREDKLSDLIPAAYNPEDLENLEIEGGRHTKDLRLASMIPPLKLPNTTQDSKLARKDQEAAPGTTSFLSREIQHVDHWNKSKLYQSYKFRIHYSICIDLKAIPSVWSIFFWDFPSPL